MKTKLLLFLTIVFSLQAAAQHNYAISGVNSWGLWSRPGQLENVGMPAQVFLDDANPTEGSVRGYVSLSMYSDADEGSELGVFEAYMTGYVISWVYLNGKWQTIKKIRKCTGASKFELRNVTFKVKHSISVEEEILNDFVLPYTLSPPGGSQPVINKKIAARGTVLDTPLPHSVTISGTGKGLFLMPPEIRQYGSNISTDCPPPGQGLTVEETYVEPEPQDEPKPKPGISITESIQAKMPLYAEGNRCISLHHLNGGPQCDDDAIEIRNNCGKLMTVQLALKQKTGHYASEIITTLQRGENKRVQTGCDKSTEGAKFVAINRKERTDLLCRPEWYLVSMIDLKGKAYVDVPYEAPKKPTQSAIPGSTPRVTYTKKQNQGGSLGDVYYPNQNKTKTYQGSKAKEFQQKSNSTSGFKITDRFFAANYTSNGKTIYSLYRFGNQSGYQGKKWFRRWEKTAGKSQEFWNAGWWERQGDYIIVTIYEEYNKRTWPPMKFKIEGESIRQVEEGRPYSPNPLKVNRFYKKYNLNGTPSWAQPAMDRMKNRFAPN